MGAFTYLKTQFFEWKEQRQVEKRFYHNPQFCAQDLTLLERYLVKSPYEISKAYLKAQGAKELYTYGETPLTTMNDIAVECELKEGDRVIEMGAGRGRTSLFLAEYLGCRVIAYEQITDFVEKSVPSPNLTMLSRDMFEADFSKACAIYLYGTMLLDEEILALAERFPQNVKIITVSYPLNDYHDQYQIKKTFTGKFPWGKTEVYWNERTCQ